MNYLLTAGWEDGVADLTERLVKELAVGRKVLWLASGGSNIRASVNIIRNIPEILRPNLTVSLVDEHFGPVGHKASNWTKLIKAGFRAGSAKLLPVLQDGLDMAATVSGYNKFIKQAFKENDTIIAQLGIGIKGDVAGILPGTPAATNTSDLVVGFEYQPDPRLTLTPKALQQVTAAYIFAFGATKRTALTQLRYSSVPVSKQPAQILKKINEAYLYSDQVGRNHA